jgi:hypothetical protein
VGKPERKILWEGQDVDEWIILKYILGRHGRVIWTG